MRSPLLDGRVDSAIPSELKQVLDGVASSLPTERPKQLALLNHLIRTHLSGFWQEHDWRLVVLWFSCLDDMTFANEEEARDWELGLVAGLVGGPAKAPTEVNPTRFGKGFEKGQEASDRILSNDWTTEKELVKRLRATLEEYFTTINPVSEIVIRIAPRRWRPEITKRTEGQRPPVGNLANSRLFSDWTPPIATGYFTGREEFLQELNQCLQKYGRVMVTAGGGGGKTQAAIEYANRFSDAYEDVLWISAADTPSLSARGREVAAALELPSQSDADVQRSLKRWMSEHPKALVIFDGLDDPGTAKPFWPTGALMPFVLVTSRRTDLDELGSLWRLELPLWDAAEAVNFLTKRTKRPNITDSEMQAMQALAQEIGFWPLALEQAASFMAITDTSFASYLEGYQRLRVTLFSRGDHQPVAGDYTVPVTLTWRASLASLPAAAQDLLAAASHLSPQAIPFELFTHSPEILSERLNEVLADLSALNAIAVLVGRLRQYSLVQVDRESKTFSIHTLLHEIIRADQTEAQQADWIGRWIQVFESFLPAIPAIDDSSTSGPYSRSEAAFLAFFARVPKQHPASTEAAKLAARYVHHMQNGGRFASAEAIAIPQIGIFQRTLGSEHDTTLRAQFNLARAYRFQGRFTEAGELWEQVCTIRERVLGPDHPDTIASLNAVVIILRDHGRYTEAETLCKRILETRERTLGPDHRDTLDSLTNLGVVYRDQGRYKEAEAVCTRAFELRKRTLGGEHPDTLGALSNLAEVIRFQGKYADALVLCEQILDTRNRVQGAEHPYTLRSLTERASLLVNLGRYEVAEPLLTGLVKTRERVQGANHPETIGACTNLGVMYRLQERYELAEPLLKHALEGYSRLMGPGYSGTLSVTFCLGELYVTQGRLREAAPLCERAYSARKDLLGENHPDTLSALGNLALIEKLNGRYDEAGALFATIVEGRERALGKDHPDTIDALVELAELRRCEGRTADARKLNKRALEGSLRVLGIDHPLSRKAQSVQNALLSVKAAPLNPN